jgi:inosine-uridine nucleoside N-ribohydrolase
MISIMAALVASTALFAAPDASIPVILDTDIGDDIDDTWALSMILGSPQFDLKLITTAFNDTPTKTRLVAKMLQELGRTDIPIGTGVRTEVKPINQAKWLGDFDLKSYPGKVYEDGVQALVDAINASPKEVTLIVIGGQTNIAAALKKDPSIAKKARVVAMAGSVRIGYEGSPKPQAEWNVVCDPKAAQAVFAAPWKITYAPLDICGTLRLKGDDYLKVEKSENPLAKLVVENCDLWVNRGQHPKDSSSILYDTVAVYLAMDESLAKVEEIKLSVSDKGDTVIDEMGRPVFVGTGWKDEQGFKDLLVKTLTGK